jgi:hypothetical protein
MPPAIASEPGRSRWKTRKLPGFLAASAVARRCDGVSIGVCALSAGALAGSAPEIATDRGCRREGGCGSSGRIPGVTTMDPRDRLDGEWVPSRWHRRGNAMDRGGRLDGSLGGSRSHRGAIAMAPRGRRDRPTVRSGRIPGVVATGPGCLRDAPSVPRGTSLGSCAWAVTQGLDSAAESRGEGLTRPRRASSGATRSMDSEPHFDAVAFRAGWTRLRAEIHVRRVGIDGA